MPRTALSLAMEYDPKRGFLELLRSYAQNDDEIPMHDETLTLFQAVAGGLVPKMCYPNIDYVIEALELMSSEHIPESWALAAGDAILNPAKRDEALDDFATKHRIRACARLAALARFASASQWLSLWNDSELGRSIGAEIGQCADTVDWANTQDKHFRLRANIAVLRNMKSDGVALEGLGANYGVYPGTYVPLLHSAASQGNKEMVSWLLAEGHNPRQKVRDPLQPTDSGREIDAFDAAREYSDPSPVIGLMKSWEARQILLRARSSPQ